jgi:hypothetical protein
MLTTHAAEVAARGNGRASEIHANGLGGPNGAEHGVLAPELQPAAKPKRPTAAEKLRIKVALRAHIRDGKAATLQSVYAEATLRYLIKEFVPPEQVLLVQRIAKREIRRILDTLALARR